MPEVLYEDNHLIAVYKPAGVLVQGDKSGEVCLMDQVKEFLKEKYNKPGNVFLGLIHRLDRNVSGIVLFAKTSKGASRLSEQWREHSVQKVYHAVVSGCPKKSREKLQHWLIKDENKNKTAIFEKPTVGALPAELEYEVVKTNKQFSLLKIILGTGRSHQIRAQLSFIGHPIVGDAKYGSKISLPNQEVALSSTSLSFDLATAKERKNILVDVPDNWEKLYA